MSHPYGLDEQSSAAHARGLAAAKVAAQRAAQVDREGKFPDESLAALASEKLLGLVVPSELGGLGAGPRAFCAVAEELGRSCASTAMIYVMHTAATQAIIAAKPLADREALLRQIANGKHLSTLALSEKGSRSQFWAPMSKLTPRGDGFVTSAAKSWVTSAKQAD